MLRGYGVQVFMVNMVLTLTTLWADSADNKLVIFFLFFLENRI